MAVQQQAWSRAALCCAAALIAGSIAVVHAQRPPASFDESYRRAQQANASMKTLTARFTESTTSSLLDKPLIARGTLTVERPSRVVLRYMDPDVRTVLIDGGRMTLTWPSRKLQQHMDISRAQGRVQRYFVEGSAAELRREFDIEIRTPSERPGTQELRLRPKRKQIRETLTVLDLWIDPATSLMAAMRMTFANGDTKTMTFSDVMTNPVLPADAFSVER